MGVVISEERINLEFDISVNDNYQFNTVEPLLFDTYRSMMDGHYTLALLCGQQFWLTVSFLFILMRFGCYII